MDKDSKDGEPTELFDGREDQWERVRIFNRDRIKPPVIYTRTESAILLLHKTESGGGRRRGPTNEPVERLGHVVFHHLGLRATIQSID